jgi:hypothetical protein
VEHELGKSFYCRRLGLHEDEGSGWCGFGVGRAKEKLGRLMGCATGRHMQRVGLHGKLASWAGLGRKLRKERNRNGPAREYGSSSCLIFETIFSIFRF